MEQVPSLIAASAGLCPSPCPSARRFPSSTQERHLQGAKESGAVSSVVGGGGSAVADPKPRAKVGLIIEGKFTEFPISLEDLRIATPAEHGGAGRETGPRLLARTRGHVEAGNRIRVGAQEATSLHAMRVGPSTSPTRSIPRLPCRAVEAGTGGLWLPNRRYQRMPSGRGAPWVGPDDRALDHLLRAA